MWCAEANAKIDIPLDNYVIHAGEKITITNGKNEHFAIWHRSGIYDLPIEYVGNITKIISQN